MSRVRTFIPCLLLLLGGCASTIEIAPTVPYTRQSAPQSTGKDLKVGLFIPPTSTTRPMKITPGTGIWPSATYSLSPGETLQADLTEITRNHFGDIGFAESPVDRKWDWVIEYITYQPRMHVKTLECQVSIGLTIRDTRNSTEVVKPVPISGKTEEQPGKMFRMVAGSWLEKRQIQRSLDDAYTDLYRKLDMTLARAAAMETRTNKARPYQRRSKSEEGSTYPSGSGRSSRSSRKR